MTGKVHWYAGHFHYFGQEGMLTGCNVEFVPTAGEGHPLAHNRAAFLTHRGKRPILVVGATRDFLAEVLPDERCRRCSEVAALELVERIGLESLL